MRTLLEIGLFFDALSLSPKASNRDIINRILRLREEFRDDVEMTELLIKAEDYLTVKRELYEGKILPYLDYIRILLRKRYGQEAEDFVIKHKLLKIEDIEQRVLPSVLLEKQFPLNNDEDKIGFIKILLAVGSEDLDYLYFDGECDNSTPLRKKAYEIALEVFQYLPEDTSLLHSLGFSLLELGDYERALTCFLKQSEKSGEDSSVWNNIAWCLMRLGRHEEALIHCERALKLLPDHSHVHHDYASILAGLGRWDEAISVIENAISNIKPEAIQLYYLLPSVLERKGDVSSAILHWEKYLKLATGKTGHERAVLRVRNKLKEKGIILEIFQSVSEDIFSDPDLRRISEETFSNISKLLERLPKLKVFARTLRSLVEKMPVQISTIADLEHLVSLLESQVHGVRQKEKDIDDLIAEIDSLIIPTILRGIGNFERKKALKVLRKVMSPNKAHHLNNKSDFELILLLSTVKSNLIKEKNNIVTEQRSKLDGKLKSLRQLRDIARKIKEEIGSEIPDWILAEQLEDNINFTKQEITPRLISFQDWESKVDEFTQKIELEFGSSIVTSMIEPIKNGRFSLDLAPLESLRARVQSEIGRKDKELEKYSNIDFASMKRYIEDIIQKIDTVIQDLSILKKKRFLDGFLGKLFGRSQKVSKIKEDALEITKRASTAFYSSGVMYRKICQYDKAIDKYTEAIKFNPNNADAYNERGICYRELGQNAKAEKDLNKLQELKKK